MARFPPQILANRAVITITGEGALAFLHNLLTADVAGLQTGRAAYGALLTPQGKILHDLFVFAGEDGIHIDCARDHQDALLQKLRMYRLRAKLGIDPSPSLAVAVSDGAPLPGLCVADPRLAAIGNRAIVAVHALATSDGYEAARLELGLADSTGDIGSSEHFVHEANLDLLNGVSFTKGCYVGQEVVSRMQHRGTARARMLPVACDGYAPAHGSAIRSGETAIGMMLSSQGRSGLALIRLDRLAEAAAPLLSTGVRITVQKPRWMKIVVAVPEPAQ